MYGTKSIFISKPNIRNFLCLVLADGKVTDFGLCALKSKETPQMQLVCGTPSYMGMGHFTSLVFQGLIDVSNERCDAHACILRVCMVAWVKGMSVSWCRSLPLAPEVLADTGAYSPLCDIWSTGVILYNLLVPLCSSVSLALPLSASVCACVRVCVCVYVPPLQT